MLNQLESSFKKIESYRVAELVKLVKQQKKQEKKKKDIGIVDDAELSIMDGTASRQKRLNRMKKKNKVRFSPTPAI